MSNCGHLYDEDGICLLCNECFTQETEGLRERIEELEEERDACVRQCPAPTIAQAAAMTHGERLYIFTTAQIDKAWRIANNHAFTNAVREGAAMALRELGIEACEGPEGDIACSDGYVAGEVNSKPCLVKCPACDDHGWKIGGEDE